MNKTRCNKQVARLADERGVALVLALVMLAIMSLLGVMALDTADTEMNLTVNLRTAQKTFVAAERAIEYGMAHGDIYLVVDKDPDNPYNLEDTSTIDHKTLISAGTGEGLADRDYYHENRVGYVGFGAPPVGSGTDPTKFIAERYMVNVTTQLAPELMAIDKRRSKTHIETQVARIVPIPN